ncbi:9421_t:CDS:2 [Rhizophagus irregularis]|nr:9421_t:CDS:2 [Rhizophagus irregularis]
MSTEEKASIAFEVEFKKNPNAPIPDHIKSKLVEEAAAQEVAHAKQVAEEQRRLSDAQQAENKAKLQENLDNAEARREEAQKEKLEKMSKLDKKPSP